MTYHPLLEDLAKWENEEHFYQRRYERWKIWADLSGVEVTQELLEKDEFKYPTTTIDFITGEPVYEVSSFLLSQNLGLEIKADFKLLFEAIKEKLLDLETENQKKSLVAFLLNEVKTIQRNIEQLGIKNLYKNIYKSEFLKGRESLEKLLPSEIVSPSQDWCFKYDHLNEDEGKESLRIAVSDLKDYGFIEKETPFRLFTKFFSGGNVVPQEKIVWTGRKGELTYFISQLVKSKFMTTLNHWVAVENCFQIIYAGKEYSTSNLNTADKTTNKEKRKRLSQIILELKK